MAQLKNLREESCKEKESLGLAFVQAGQSFGWLGTLKTNLSEYTGSLTALVNSWDEFTPAERAVFPQFTTTQQIQQELDAHTALGSIITALIRQARFLDSAFPVPKSANVNVNPPAEDVDDTTTSGDSSSEHIAQNATATAM